MLDIGIIGAGVTGLSAAYDLTRRGHRVTVYEARPYVGGLSAGFRDERWEWSLARFYHHWFATDRDVIGLISELGLSQRLFFPRPTTSLYYQGGIYPLDSGCLWGGQLTALRLDGEPRWIRIPCAGARKPEEA